MPRDAILAAHRLLARAPSHLVSVTLEDAVAETERPNMPGADGRRSNWSLALPVPLEVLETEPLPGHYPSEVGLPLLKESLLNHLGKLMFQWFYWHSLLPGRDIPGIGAAMPSAGKQLISSATQEQ